MSFRSLAIRLAAGAVLVPLATPSGAAEYGMATPWQLGLQGAVTPIAERLHDFNTLLLAIISAIVLFVMAMLAWCIYRFNERANPVPAPTTHNTMLEVAWTVLPVLILIVIAIPSFRLLYAQYDIPKADLTIKATGHQWYWNYEYQAAAAENPGQAIAAATDPANAEFAFDSIILKDDELKPGQPRLLSVDNELVVPVGKVVRVLTTSVDVIHAFAVPSFGIKADSVPGRLNEMWFNADREGIYYGQCSELCGRDHAFMPIAVRVVSEADFAAWREEARKRFAVNVTEPPRALADAGPAPAR